MILHMGFKPPLPMHDINEGGRLLRISVIKRGSIRDDNAFEFIDSCVACENFGDHVLPIASYSVGTMALTFVRLVALLGQSQFYLYMIWYSIRLRGKILCINCIYICGSRVVPR